MSNPNALDPLNLAKISDDLVKAESTKVIELNSSSSETNNPKKLTPRQWATVGMLTFAILFSTVSYSFMAPFFPGEARKKNLNTTETGIIFGIFELVMLITSPLIGKYVSTCKHLLYLNGLFFRSISSVPKDSSPLAYSLQESASYLLDFWMSFLMDGYFSGHVSVSDVLQR